MYYLQALIGHYTKGTEQLGIVSSLDSQDFILKSNNFLEGIGKEYGI
jgi:hypothetical protein